MARNRRRSSSFLELRGHACVLFQRTVNQGCRASDDLVPFFETRPDSRREFAPYFTPVLRPRAAADGIILSSLYSNFETACFTGTLPPKWIGSQIMITFRISAHVSADRGFQIAALSQEIVDQAVALFQFASRQGVGADRLCFLRADGARRNYSSAFGRCSLSLGRLPGDVAGIGWSAPFGVIAGANT